MRSVVPFPPFLTEVLLPEDRTTFSASTQGEWALAQIWPLDVEVSTTVDMDAALSNKRIDYSFRGLSDQSDQQSTLGR